MTELNESGQRSLTGRLKTRIRFADQALFFSDPAGNHYAVYTPNDPTENANRANGRMTGVGYIELEAPDVNASIDFYAKVLGFELQSRTRRHAGRPRSRWPAARL